MDNSNTGAPTTNLVIPISASLSHMTLAQASSGSNILLRIAHIFIRELAVKAVLS